MPRRESPLQNEMLQGTLDMLVLRTLVLGPAHGHTIARWHERWCVRGRAPEPECEEPACPASPGAFHFAEATRVVALTSSILQSIIDRKLLAIGRASGEFVLQSLKRLSSGAIRNRAERQAPGWSPAAPPRWVRLPVAVKDPQRGLQLERQHR